MNARSQIRTALTGLLASVLVLAGISTGAFGQGIGQPPATGGAGAQAQNVSDQELQATAQAYLEIQQLRRQYRQQHGRIASLDSAQARKVQRQFQQETRQILQNQSNLSPFRFSQIMRTAQQDSTLRRRLMSAIQQQGGQAMSPAAAAGTPRTPTRRAPAGNFDSEQITAAAQAYVAIQKVKARYRETQDADPDESGTQALGAEIIETIQDHDLTQETFKQVMLGARRSAQLRTQLLSAIDQAEQDGASASG